MDGATDLPAVEVANGISRVEFEQLYQTHVRRVYTFLARRVGHALAEDLAAQTFLEAWAGRHRFDAAQGSETSWLYGIAMNLLRRHRRRENSQLRAFARAGTDPVVEDFDENAAADRLMVSEGWQRVAAALAEMSDAERDVLTLAGWAQLSYEEIAQVLEIPIGTVRSRLSRGRLDLARRLAPAIDLG